MAAISIFKDKNLKELVARTLFERFLEFKARDAEDVCGEFEIVVQKFDTLKPTCGALIPGVLQMPLRAGGFIHVSAHTELKEVREFVIYHELAHLFLIFAGIPSPEEETPEEESPEYWICEAWCDNFAFTMVLAKFGFEAVSEETAVRYFEQGEEIGNGLERNRHIAMRLLGYCKGGAWADHESELPPLMKLAQKFLE